MSKKRYKWLVLSSVSAVTACAMFAVGANAASGVFGADHTNHEGYHYERVESTCVEHGHEEFWTCCVCHQHFTTQPTGNFTDRGSQDPYAGVVPEDVLLELADHQYEYQVPTTKIGNKTGVCETCEDSIEVPMVSSDINFSGRDAYGANAGMLITTPQEGNRGILGGLLWQGEDGGTVSSVSFPKIDYTVFSNVVFEFGTSTATWGGSYVRLSINSENDLLDIPSGVEGVYGSITARYNEESDSISLTSVTSTGLTKTVVVTDDDVISGASSLSGEFGFGSWRCFYLNKIIVDHTEHTGSGSAVASNFRIGHKVEMCADCLCEIPSEELMGDADIDLYKGYGIGMEGLSGYSGYNGQRIVLSDGSNNVGKVFMPKVEFSAYSSVRFSMYYMTLWGRLGFDADHTIGGFGDGSRDAVIYLDVTKTTEGYDAVLSCPGKSASISTTIVAQDVIYGTSSLELYHSQSGYSCLCFSGVSVTAE